MALAVRSTLTAWGALAVLVQPQSALAADAVQECITHHVDGQSLRNGGRLKAAQVEFAQCSGAPCPGLVRDECVALLAEVSAALPSILLSALDENGAPTSAVMVSIEGWGELIPLDGRSITLDPGEHRVRFQHSRGATRDVTVTLMQFEHNRRVEADFRIPPGTEGLAMAPTEALPGEMQRESSAMSPVLIASGSVALSALGGFTLFALSGRAVEKELDRCKPSCEDRSQLERLRTRYVAADISLGVALVSIAVGTYAWLMSPSESAALAPDPARPSGLQLQPVASLRHVGFQALGEF